MVVDQRHDSLVLLLNSTCRETPYILRRWQLAAPAFEVGELVLGEQSAGPRRKELALVAKECGLPLRAVWATTCEHSRTRSHDERQDQNLLKI